jgi:DNA mismatch repair protein MutL
MKNLSKNEIKKLPQELINQIAAGEVIERPASVIKELVDNSIDANSTKIKIRIQSGGMKLIEISDNGIGIKKKMIPLAFEAHSTSKINSIEDLNNLVTMGFRGEALSTIVSISELTVLAKSEDDTEGYKVDFDGISPTEAQPAPRETGTTITIRNLFYNIPARKKYLKSEETEYRKILNILIPYFLLYPNIHFIFEKEGKVIYNLPVTDAKSSEVSLDRVKEVLKNSDNDNLLPLYYDGGGLSIVGYIGHPSMHTARTNHMYVFVNDRPVQDRGVIRSVMEGYDRYIPHKDKVPFIINLKVNPELVDVNVHPRKEEVRFLNPYRIYSAIEKAVSVAISKGVQDDYTPSFDSVTSESPNSEIALNRLRGENYPRASYSSEYSDSGSSRELSFRKPAPFLVQDSLEFSRNLLDESEVVGYCADEIKEFLNAYQLFKKYLLIEFEDEAWIVDQHAAAERITFERLLSSNEVGNTDVQNLLVPIHINKEEEEIVYLRENIDFYEKIGFILSFDDSGVLVESVPVEFVGSDIEVMFNDVLELSDDRRDLIRNFDRAREDILATIACHTSIRTNQRLAREECISIVEQLLACKNPYSCPHGRPIVWKLSLSEIDKNFDRTY